MDSAYFPYGNKSIEFLLKRTLYLCNYLNNRVDKIILACNTLSLIALPFVRLFFNNIYGVFDSLTPYINDNSAILASNATIKYLKLIYPNNLLIDGTELINKLERKLDYSQEIKLINTLIKDKNNIILACTHFIKLNKNNFVIKAFNNLENEIKK